MRRISWIISLCLIMGLYFFSFMPANAQKTNLFPPVNIDSQYIESYKKTITGRIYFSQKYTSVSLDGNSKYPNFRYRPNTSLNFGVGMTYDMFTLNLAYGFPGLNGNSAQRGKTRYLDLQSHIYSRRFVIDVFGQFYKGFYIAPKNYVPGIPGFYQNPDLGISLMGFSAYYLFSPSRFSYQAALIQNEWQKRSSGTFLAGIDFYYGILSDEQYIIPEEIHNQFLQGKVNRLRFINFGPGVGYAYNFVYKKHWFAIGSLTGTLTADFTKENEESLEKTHLNVSPNFMYRLGVGYNSSNWEAVFTLVNSTVKAIGGYRNNSYTFRTGNYRLTFAHRFSLKSKISKALKPKLESIEP